MHHRCTSDFAAHIDSIQDNPVERGFVENIDDLPHSSCHRWKRINRVLPAG